MFIQTQLVDSFSVQGGLLEHIFPVKEKHLIAYSHDKIRIYGLSYNSLAMLYQIDLQTNIKKVVFLQNQDAKQSIQPHHPLGKIAILNDLAQLVLITPYPPFQHKHLPLPSNFKENISMTTTQNKLALILQQDVNLVVYFQTSKNEYHYTTLDLRTITMGKTIQVDCSRDGHLFILTHQYERPIMTQQYLEERQQTLNVQNGSYKSTIHQVKLTSLLQQHRLDQHKKTNYSFLALQIHALEQDELLVLTTTSLFCLKKVQTEQSINVQFMQPISPNSFMTFISEKHQILICNPPTIQIVQVYVDHYRSVSFLQLLQYVGCTLGITELSVITINENERALSFIWMQTEIGAAYLGYLTEHTQKEQIEPDIQKKIKVDQQLPIKILHYFPTLKKIYDFVKFPNHLFILAGGSFKQVTDLNNYQQLSRVNVGIQMIQNQSTATFKVNLQNFLQQSAVKYHFVTSDGLFIIQISDIQFHRVSLSAASQELILQQSIFQVQEQETLLGVYLYYQKIYILHFDSKLIGTDLNKLYPIKIKLKQLSTVDNFMMGLDEQDQLVYTSQWPVQELILLSTQIPESKQFTIFSLAQLELTVYLLLQNSNKFVIYLFQNNKFKQVFVAHNFNGGVPQIYNELNYSTELNQKQLQTSITCPSVELKPVCQQSPQQVKCSFIYILGQSSLIIGLLSDELVIYRTNLSETSFQVLQRLIFPMSIPKILIPRLPLAVLVNGSSIYLDQTGIMLNDNNGKVSAHQLQGVIQMASLSFIHLNKSIFSISSMPNHDVGVQIMSQFDHLSIPSDNIQLKSVVVQSQKSTPKSIFILEQLTLSGQAYLIVVSRLNELFKSEILIYKVEQLNQPIVEYTEFEGEEIIKLQVVQCNDGSALLVVLSLFQFMQGCESRVRTIKFVPSQKSLKLQDNKTVKDMIPTDMIELKCFQQMLISTGEQLKFFDPNANKTSNLIVLHLQDSITKIQPINIVQIQSCDHWIALLDNRFRVIIAKFIKQIMEPKIEWIVEFGVNHKQALLDVQLTKINERMTFSIVDSLYNLHLYNISQEKSKIKKLADCNIYGICKLRIFNESFLVSTSFGQLYQLSWENESSKYQVCQLVTDQLPYIGGYHPKNKIGCRKAYENQQTMFKGQVCNCSFLNIYDNLTNSIKETIDKRVNNKTEDQNQFFSI